VSVVGLAIPTIPPRHELLERALLSADAQTRPFDHLAVVSDVNHEGAAATRDRAWRMLLFYEVDWVAFMDDDDELCPDHLEKLLACAEREGADFVYPWFTVCGGTDPFPENFGRPFDPTDPAQTTVTGLWRTSALEAVGGFSLGFDPGAAGLDSWGNRAGEEHEAVKRLVAAGGRVVHLPERTWLWHHDSGNTSGRPDRW
jgi:hypothetical protein